MTKSPNANDGLDDMEPLPEPPGSTARDKDLRIAELEANLRRVTDSAELLAAELTDPGTEALAAIYCARTTLKQVT